MDYLLANLSKNAFKEPYREQHVSELEPQFLK